MGSSQSGRCLVTSKMRGMLQSILVFAHGCQTNPWQLWMDEFYSACLERSKRIGNFTRIVFLDESSSIVQSLPRNISARLLGDIPFVFQELFNLKCGWSSHQLCHHCLVTKNDYLNFPSALHLQPRRDLDSFLSATRVANDPSRWAAV